MRKYIGRKITLRFAQSIDNDKASLPTGRLEIHFHYRPKNNIGTGVNIKYFLSNLWWGHYHELNFKMKTYSIDSIVAPIITYLTVPILALAFYSNL